MDQEKQTLFAMDGVNGSVGASQGARRATEEVPTEPAGRLPDPEVVALAKRRRFTAGYKGRILRAAAACKASGEVGPNRPPYLRRSASICPNQRRRPTGSHSVRH